MLQAHMKVPIGSLAVTIEKTGGQSAGKTRTFVREPSETIRLAISQFDENKNSFLFEIMTTHLNPQWIVGFVDGEGCFNIDVHTKSDMRWGLQIQPEFTVVQNEIDVQILYAFKDFFQCGSVGVNRRDKHGTRYHYRVKNVKDLNEKIIPFFEKHSLKTKKKIEYQRFRRICLRMNQGYHRESLKNFLEIYDLGVGLRVRSRQKKVSEKSQGIEKIVLHLRESLQNEDSSKMNE